MVLRKIRQALDSVKWRFLDLAPVRRVRLRLMVRRLVAALRAGGSLEQALYFGYFTAAKVWREETGAWWVTSIEVDPADPDYDLGDGLGTGATLEVRVAGGAEATLDSPAQVWFEDGVGGDSELAVSFGTAAEALAFVAAADEVYVRNPRPALAAAAGW